jgi:phospholipid/cholesterol/gamma-HCH transport system permease protein
VRSAVVAVGSAALRVAEQAGGIGVLAGRIGARLFPPRFDGSELVRNLYRMGVRSLPIVLVTALFAGGIMVLQAGMVIRRYGAEGVLGWAAGFATLREIGPILIALMLSGRVGANNTAELGTMVVTEQIDALRTLAIDPISFLVIPRVVAMVIVLFLLTIFGDVVALIGAAITGDALLGVSPRAFYRSLVEMLGFWDVATGLIKSVVFGLLLGLSSCAFGLAVKGGAPGVGRAVHASVVASAAGVFVLDYLLTYLLR